MCGASFPLWPYLQYSHLISMQWLHQAEGNQNTVWLQEAIVASLTQIKRLLFLSSISPRNVISPQHKLGSSQVCPFLQIFSCIRYPATANVISSASGEQTTWLELSMPLSAKHVCKSYQNQDSGPYQTPIWLRKKQNIFLVAWKIIRKIINKTKRKIIWRVNRKIGRKRR